jgi:Domain of unknown function (DUF4169)
MAEIINLKLVRKMREREAREKLAAESRAAHGRSKAERERIEAQLRLNAKRLEALKRDRETD